MSSFDYGERIRRNGEPSPGYKRNWIIGNGPVTITVAKFWPSVFIHGTEINLDPFTVYPLDDKEYSNERGWRGSINGCSFDLYQYGSRLAVHLHENDGTVWEGTCGYGIEEY